jgi:uncharacterized protein YndB with AHSA1/START domain
MSDNEIHVDAPPEAVWSVLADPETYGEWVVGASHVRGAEPDFPAPGSTFHHAQGMRPFIVEDTTTALAADRPHRLSLLVRVRPIMIGRVDFELIPVDGGTRVRMHEQPIAGLVAPLHNPLLDLVFKARNAESLRRLKRLAEERAGAGGAGRPSEAARAA